MRTNTPIDDEELRELVIDVLSEHPQHVAERSQVIIRHFVMKTQQVVGELVRRLEMK